MRCIRSRARDFSVEFCAPGFQFGGMKALLRHPIRVIGRLLWMNAEFIIIAVVFVFRCGFRPSHATVLARASWLQFATRRFLRIFRATVHTSGPMPSNGLLVCNHLSYVDILVLSSL